MKYHMLNKNCFHSKIIIIYQNLIKKLRNIIYLSKSPSIELCLDVGREAWCRLPGIRLDKEAWGLPPANILFMLSSRDGDPDNRPRIEALFKYL